MASPFKTNKASHALPSNETKDGFLVQFIGGHIKQTVDYVTLPIIKPPKIYLFFSPIRLTHLDSFDFMKRMIEYNGAECSLVHMGKGHTGILPFITSKSKHKSQTERGRGGWKNIHFY